MTQDTLQHEVHHTDVCVVGGGLAGLCAAVASARNGARTVLIHDRPVLGGNASSEVRMWICGAHGPTNTETGLLEEIKLDNAYRNPALSYSVWDNVLWEKAAFEPNLTLLLNASVCDGHAEDRNLAWVKAWQLTSQTWHTVHARTFIDCSGDSILAPLSGARTRRGREAVHEYGEDIAPQSADAKTMGNSLLVQLRRTDKPEPFVRPKWAHRFESPEDLPFRIRGVQASNFWWVEVGGLNDTITDAEAIRDDLYKTAWGVWDYIKNVSPERDEARNWSLEWLGSLPGKRENRRYLGAHTMTQHDVRKGFGHFDDTVAYGGWSMDDHHPAGIYYPGKPTLFHEAPSPYDIPYRCLYSIDVDNLLCAGRNISVTHAALSSTRVMGTTSLLGQAAGTAAALCIKHGLKPGDLSSGPRLRELQRTLMDDDAWLPGIDRPADDLAAQATLSAPGDQAEALMDGTDRDRPDTKHAWQGAPGTPIEFTWSQPVNVPGLRVVFDSNLADEKKMPCSYPQRSDKSRMPSTLVKSFRVETRDASGRWTTAYRESENHLRLVRVPLNVQADAVRLVPESTWGSDTVRIFACEPQASFTDKQPTVPQGLAFTEARARHRAEDLAEPDHGMETQGAGHRGGA